MTSFTVHAESMNKCLRGWEATETGKHQEAITLFEECINQGNLSNKHLARTYRNLGITYRRLHEFNKSVLSYNKAIDLNPDDVVNDYINRGNAYDQNDKFEEALADYDTALKLKPNYDEAHYNKGIFYEHNKMFDKAKSEFMLAYQNGLRSSDLYDRFIVYGLIKELPFTWLK